MIPALFDASLPVASRHNFEAQNLSRLKANFCLGTLHLHKFPEKAPQMLISRQDNAEELTSLFPILLAAAELVH